MRPLPPNTCWASAQQYLQTRITSRAWWAALVEAHGLEGALEALAVRRAKRRAKQRAQAIGLAYRQWVIASQQGN